MWWGAHELADVQGRRKGEMGAGPRGVREVGCAGKKRGRDGAV